MYKLQNTLLLYLTVVHSIWMYATLDTSPALHAVHQTPHTTLHALDLKHVSQQQSVGVQPASSKNSKDEQKARQHIFNQNRSIAMVDCVIPIIGFMNGYYWDSVWNTSWKTKIAGKSEKIDGKWMCTLGTFLGLVWFPSAVTNANTPDLHHTMLLSELRDLALAQDKERLKNRLIYMASGALGYFVNNIYYNMIMPDLT